MRIVIEYHSDAVSDQIEETTSHWVPYGTKLADAVEEALYVLYELTPLNARDWFEELRETGRAFFRYGSETPVEVSRLEENKFCVR